MLDRLRLGPNGLRGRRYPEPSHPYRNDFQRDRDRIIHSRAFRRLEGKTQVFAAGRTDHVRNRLTHTIEVSQVARTIAHALGLNEEYTETLALAHDLGHPPFGHSGEKELDRQMQRFGDSFEHNRHSLRIVDTLEERYARFSGLNLTFEVREGIVKHSRELPVGDLELYDLFPGERPALEAQLLNFADEIAYNSADLDDAFAAGLLEMDEIAAAVPVFADFAEQVKMQFPGSPTRIQFWEIHRQLMNSLIGGLIDGTVQAAEHAGVENVADVRALDSRIATFTPAARELSSQLKTLLINRVYENSDLVNDRSVAVVKVRELFEFLLSHPDQVSAGYRESLGHSPAYRVVCDYIAGMTDAFFLRTYEVLLGETTRG
ncbi:MAG: dNTP triphosphohydrolase [Acidobacteriaceae bacterium]|nr:dNTP triphosphohydrolase [Acidobacteriaceae bacterium]